MAAALAANSRERGSMVEGSAVIASPTSAFFAGWAKAPVEISILSDDHEQRRAHASAGTRQKRTSLPTLHANALASSPTALQVGQPRCISIAGEAARSILLIDKPSWK